MAQSDPTRLPTFCPALPCPAQKQCFAASDGVGWGFLIKKEQALTTHRTERCTRHHPVARYRAYALFHGKPYTLNRHFDPDPSSRALVRSQRVLGTHFWTISGLGCSTQGRARARAWSAQSRGIACKPARPPALFSILGLGLTLQTLLEGGSVLFGNSPKP